MSEKMREEFEKWASELLLPMDNVGGSYVHTGVNRRWQAWQASRAALVVELPQEDIIFSNMAPIADFIGCLEDAGVSYK